MKDIYENPLCTRYAGKKMQQIFSSNHKFSTWRKLWTSLAKNEKALGLNITDEQILELSENIDNIDYETAERYERQLRHDVMAHIKTFGDACPNAKGIIHLGATSCYVDDNGDIIIIREAVLQIKAKLVGVLNSLRNFAIKNKDVPTLAYTHFQAAQPTTVGKRACLWAQDIMLDLVALENVLKMLKFPGCKGATGTAASFLNLFDGDVSKTLELEKLIAKDFGFDEILDVSGQTYTRKLDYFVLALLSGIAQSASKTANDLRLLSHLKEFDEPFEIKQVGSSAMAYKRNPMRSERICSLARYVIVDALNASVTASTQWLERSLDDSANKRISIPEAFLAVDGILTLLRNIIDNGTVYPLMAMKHIKAELPFMATENILMEAVKKGGDRQELHEKIRLITTEATKKTKLLGEEADIIDMISNDSAFNLSKEELQNLLDINLFIGIAREQTQAFTDKLEKIISENSSFLEDNDEINC